MGIPASGGGAWLMIDAHVHLWRLARGDNLALTPLMEPIYRDREPEHLRPLLDAAGINRIVVVQAAWTLAETLFTIGLSERHPWIAGVVGWADPLSPSLVEEIAALSLTGKLKGIRPVSPDDNRSIGWMLDARFERCWSLMRERGLVLDFLLQNPDEVPLVTHFARRHPELRIVLDHCAKPDIAGGNSSPGPTTSRSWRNRPTSPANFPACSTVPPRAPAPMCSGPTPLTSSTGLAATG